MTHDGGVRTGEDVRQQILDGAVSEFAAKNFSGFTLEGAAARAGVDVQTVRQLWANGPELLTAALRDYGERHLPIPDTGTLHGDLLEYAKSYAAMIGSPTGRRLMDAVIIKPVDWDLSVSRPTYLEKREVRMSAVLQRGIQRGECAPGIDIVRIIDMIEVALCVPIMLYDRPITDEDCELVIDVVLNGIGPRGT